MKNEEKLIILEEPTGDWNKIFVMCKNCGREHSITSAPSEKIDPNMFSCDKCGMYGTHVRISEFCNKAVN